MKKNRIEQAITSAIFAITIVILSIFTFTAYKPSESQVSNQSLFSDSDVSSTATVDKISNTKSYPIPGEVSNSNLAPEQLPTPTADPPKPSDPYAVVLIPEVVAVDPVDATKASSHIVYGKVIEVLAPRWSTPDGKRPDNPFEQQFAIFTPIRIAVIETLKGAKQENVTIYVPSP